MKTKHVLLTILICVLAPLVLVTCTILSAAGRWAGEAVSVAQEEFGPRELLAKYEWFKDAAAQLDKKQADAKIFEVKLNVLTEIPRERWDRTDKEQYGVWAQEVAGVKASYNGLAAEYNAQMAKFNWRFCNVGTLPQGATVPLPREFKPYAEN